jgi:hypothetical protein
MDGVARISQKASEKGRKRAADAANALSVCAWTIASGSRRESTGAASRDCSTAHAVLNG